MEDLPPVVFVHGWKASKLVDANTGKDEYVMTLPVLTGIARDPDLSLPREWDENGRQIKDNLVATEPLYDVKTLYGMVKLADLYGPFLNFLKGNRDLHIFTYDWRRALDETSQSLENFILDVMKSTKEKPQVVGHSMGCLVTLSVLNRRPDIFHSVLFGAAAYGPNFSAIKDHSVKGYSNQMVRNNTMFSPTCHVTNPSSFFMLGSAGEREQWGRETRHQLHDEESKPIPFDVHKLETLKELKLAMFHPQSGIQHIDKEKEAWMQSVLDKCLAFRKALVPANCGNDQSVFPPVSVIRGDHTDCEFGYVKRADGVDLFRDIKTFRGDGRITLEDALPPKDIPVCKVVTNGLEHSEVLNDIPNVNMLLSYMVGIVDSKAT